MFPRAVCPDHDLLPQVASLGVKKNSFFLNHCASTISELHASSMNAGRSKKRHRERNSQNGWKKAKNKRKEENEISLQDHEDRRLQHPKMSVGTPLERS